MSSETSANEPGPAGGGPASHATRGAGLALGVALARSGWMAIVALAVGAITTLAAVGIAVAISRGGEEPPLGLVPGATAAALAWGAGILLAFATAAHALRRDREEGVRSLLAFRGKSPRAYLGLRVGGLAVLLGVVIGGGATVAGIAAAVSAPSTHLAGAALLGTVGALVYAAAFAAVLAPVAFAALGARSRAGGYLWLLALLFVPELLSGLIATIVPEGWDDVFSVPGALDTLRTALSPDSLDLARIGRAAVVLVAVATFGAVVTRMELHRVERERLP